MACPGTGVGYHQAGALRLHALHGERRVTGREEGVARHQNQAGDKTLWLGQVRGWRTRPAPCGSSLSTVSGV